MARPRKKTPPPPSQSVRARLIGLGGQRPDGSPDIRGISQRIGRSPRSVRRYLASERIPEKTNVHVAALEAADARKPAWIPANDEGPTGRALMGQTAGKMPPVTDVRGSLLASWARPDGSVDTRAAAEALGKSQRTVQRWAKGENRPKIESQEAIRSHVRDSMLGGKRGSRMANIGAEVEVEARIQISGDIRHRKIGHNTPIRLSGQDMDKIRAAYASGGDGEADKELAKAVARSGYGKQIGMDPLSMTNVTDVTFRR